MKNIFSIKYSIFRILFCFIIYFITFELIYPISLTNSIKTEIISSQTEFSNNVGPNYLFSHTTLGLNYSLYSNLLDKESNLIFGPIFEISRVEDFAESLIYGLQIGRENYFIMGLSGSYLTSLHFDTNPNQVNSFMYIGDQNASHFNIINYGGLVGFFFIPVIFHDNRIEMELSLGYKKILPFHLIFNINGTNFQKDFSWIVNDDFTRYSRSIVFCHIIFYRPNYHISTGYSLYYVYLGDEQVTEIHADGFSSKNIYSYRDDIYQGIGTTMTLFNIYNNVDLASQFHLLFNKKYNTIGILKFSIKHLFVK